MSLAAWPFPIFELTARRDRHKYWIAGGWGWHGHQQLFARLPISQAFPHLFSVSLSRSVISTRKWVVRVIPSHQLSLYFVANVLTYRGRTFALTGLPRRVCLQSGYGRRLSQDRLAGRRRYIRSNQSGSRISDLRSATSSGSEDVGRLSRQGPRYL